MRCCFACHGPYHPATGHLFRELGIAYCGPCTRHFYAWVNGHTKRRWGGADFYEAATSVREGVYRTWRF